MSSTVIINVSSVVLLLAGLIGLLLSFLMNNSLALIASLTYIATGAIMLLIELRSKKQFEYLK